MSKSLSINFYDIQRQQWRKSFFLFIILVVFYFISVVLVSGFLVTIFALILSHKLFPAGGFLARFLLLNLAVSLSIASFHLYDARKFGARFILKRLRAMRLDPSDRYHKQFTNTVDEIRISSGLPEVIPFIIPSFAINSMALIGPTRKPIVCVTEGLLAEFTRNEIQAVVAHELSHIIRGDAFYLTLVCSLTNFFERLRMTLEPEDKPPSGTYPVEGGITAAPLAYLAVTVSSIIMHLISTLISREREILADAVAVELCRNPKALARAIYKAHLKNSFVGDFSLTYSPLFIVPPESRGSENGFFRMLFNSHPPLMKRIKLLSDMAKTKPARIIEEVWDIQKNREKARKVLYSLEEKPAAGSLFTRAEAKEQQTLKPRVWALRDPRGNWKGPYTLEELFFLKFFTPMIWVENLQEGVQARAREFPQIRSALFNLMKKKPIDPSKQNRCPRCQSLLSDSFHEGVAIKVCRQCGGKLVDAGCMERIISRKEVTHSKYLIKKALKFKEEFIMNPVGIKRINSKKSPDISCPNCGSRMLPRPFTYHYIIPVDKCLSCYKIWFDADELEILQILTEK